MTIATLVLLTLLTGTPPIGPSACEQLGPINDNQIKISIATGGVPYRAAKDTFRVGEPIPVVVTMTNTGTVPVYVCESGTLYQDRPQLLTDGKPVTYASYRQSTILADELDQACKNVNLPQQVLLPPNEPVIVDWFNLAQGIGSLYDNGWYDSLPAGKYTLKDLRRLSCCDGPLSESNTITFVVVP